MVLPGLWVRLRLWIFPVALPLVLCAKVLQRGLLSPLGLAWLGLSRLGLSWLGMARWMGRAPLGLETMVGPGSRASVVTPCRTRRVRRTRAWRHNPEGVTKAA